MTEEVGVDRCIQERDEPLLRARLNSYHCVMRHRTVSLLLIHTKIGRALMLTQENPSVMICPKVSHSTLIQPS